MTKVYVNGRECNLHESVGWLNYDRVVRLADKLDWSVDLDGYDVTYDTGDGYGYRALGSGVLPLENMYFWVLPKRKKSWWRWLWPS